MMTTNISKYISKGKPTNESTGEIELNMKTCIGCTMCANVCPYNNFVMETVDIDGETTIKATVKDEYLCKICDVCISACPTRSITIKSIKK